MQIGAPPKDLVYPGRNPFNRRRCPHGLFWDSTAIPQPNGHIAYFDWCNVSDEHWRYACMIDKRQYSYGPFNPRNMETIEQTCTKLWSNMVDADALLMAYRLDRAIVGPESLVHDDILRGAHFVSHTGETYLWLFVTDTDNQIVKLKSLSHAEMLL